MIIGSFFGVKFRCRPVPDFASFAGSLPSGRCGRHCGPSGRGWRPPWWDPRTSHDAAELDRRVTHVSIIDPHHPLFGTDLRLAKRTSRRGAAVIVVILSDGRERSVPRAATNLAEDPIPESIIFSQARISVRSLLPLANRIRIMLRCHNEVCGGAALPGRGLAPSARSGADLVAATCATAVVQSFRGDATTAGTADGAAYPAPAISAEPYGGA